MPEYVFHQPVTYHVDAAETLREIGERPHMLLRIHLRGGYFPHRNAYAFARIREKQMVYEALLNEVDDDERGLRAYFPTDVPLKGVLEVGFENEVVTEFVLSRLKLERQKLDARKIEGAFHRVKLRDLGVFQVKR